jgi:hypothetical protein
MPHSVYSRLMHTCHNKTASLTSPSPGRWLLPDPTFFESRTLSAKGLLFMSIKAFNRHSAPKISVPPAIGAKPEAFVSNDDASCLRARVRLSVNTPCASGVQPFRISRTDPNDSVVIVDTTTRYYLDESARNRLILEFESRLLALNGSKFEQFRSYSHDS